MHAVFLRDRKSRQENPEITQTATEVLTSPKALSFGDFSLCQQRKVTRPLQGAEALFFRARARSLDPRLRGDDEQSKGTGFLLSQE
jgi:hypothetical protein